MKDKDKTKEQLSADANLRSDALYPPDALYPLDTSPTELAELRQWTAGLDASETGRQQAEEAVQWSRMWLPTASMFVVLCILVWLDEIMNLPYLLLGVSRTPINWQEALIETVLIATVGLFAVLRLIHSITGHRQAQEALRRAHDELEVRVRERTAELARANEELQGEIAERVRAEEKIEHLNAVLRAIRNVNQLIARESDRDRLLQGACDNLIETRGYHNAWIALLDETGRLVTSAEAGLGDGFLPLIERLKRGELTTCGRRAMAQSEVEVTEDPFSACADCPLAGKYSGRGAMTVRLEHGGKVYGLLSVSVPRELATDEEERTLFAEVAGDIAFALYSIELEEKRQRAEEALRRRNRELALLNRAGQALISTLDLDQILVTVLEEVCRLLGAVASSVWLVDPATDELVCQQATGPHSEVVRGWRLAPGQGISGWVARHGESLVVPDVWDDERYFRRVDQQIELKTRSILSVPLQAKEDVIGVLQVVSTEVDRFSSTDLELIESLSAPAAIAIENARLYEHVRQDAETKATLLNEVNHRVKNNLSAIIGLLYAERRLARASARGVEEQAVYQSIMRDLTGRVQGLATVHSLLSASRWAPLSLSELTTQIIYVSLQTLPHDKRISVDVTSSPVRVTSDQAHNLALVINELTTNAVKYGLHERSAARITVRIGLDDDDAAARTVLFEFRNDGPSYPEEVLQLERHGVGFDLIQNIVRKSLRGELSLHNDHGAVTVIRFKAQA